MKRITIALVSLVLVSGMAWAEKQVDETRPADPDARVSVEIISGSIRVTGWDRNEVHITGSIGDDVDALEISGSGRSIAIDLDVPDSWGRRRRDIDANLEISVPTAARVSVETVSANIAVNDVSGSIAIEVDEMADLITNLSDPFGDHFIAVQTPLSGSTGRVANQPRGTSD